MENADLAALVKELNRDDIVRYHGREDLSEIEYITYGQVRTVPSNGFINSSDLYLPNRLGGSDYSGGLIAKSNYNVFMREFRGAPGVYDMSGGHHSYGVAIRLDAITDEMLGIFKSLEDYAILDEGDHSKLEQEAQDEAWTNWVSGDFKKGLEKLLVESDLQDRILNPDAMGDVDIDDVIASVVDDLSDGDLYELFRAGEEEANVYWKDSEGEGVSIDVGRILENTDLSKLAAEVLNRIPRAALEEPDWEAPPPVDPRQMKLPGVSERRRRRR